MTLALILRWIHLLWYLLKKDPHRGCNVKIKLSGEYFPKYAQIGCSCGKVFFEDKVRLLRWKKALNEKSSGNWTGY